MTDEQMIMASANGGAEQLHEFLPVDPDSFIGNTAAQKKYNLSNSILYKWRKHKTVEFVEGKGYRESDIVKATNDPKFQSNSRARRRVLAEGRGRVKPGRKPGRKRAETDLQQHQTQAPARIGHHVAYLAGRTDEFIAQYVRHLGGSISERDLAHGLAQVLHAR